MENYIEYYFKVNPLQPWQEILLAELSIYEFDSFEEVSDGLKAYIPEKFDNQNLITGIWLLNHPEVKITYTKTMIPPINWNIEWEKNFQPIVVKDKCYIRADFHPSEEKYPYEIIIQPKMSFGTGHHHTTYMMLDFLLKLDVKNKTIMDMGCGTGILAILAKKLGAKKVCGVDYDNWAIENANENKLKNHTEIEFYLGDVNKLAEINLMYDIFLANINKNILLNDIENYAKTINSKGILLLSGILENDFDEILELCKKFGLNFVEKKQRSEWISICLKK